MKKKLNIGFVVTLSGRWPHELPEKRLKEYGDWLEQNAEHAEVFRFPRLVSSKDDMNECAAYFTENKVDLIVLVYGAFTGDDIPCGLADMQRDEYFIADLIGLKVQDEDGTELGTVKDVIETGANDVYEVEMEDGRSLLLPAIKQCILNVDVENGMMQVHVLEGLLDL